MQRCFAELEKGFPKQLKRRMAQYIEHVLRYDRQVQSAIEGKIEDKIVKEDLVLNL